jgi:hypothetical protein
VEKKEPVSAVRSDPHLPMVARHLIHIAERHAAIILVVAFLFHQALNLLLQIASV